MRANPAGVNEEKRHFLNLKDVVMDYMLALYAQKQSYYRHITGFRQKDTHARYAESHSGGIYR